MMLFEKILSFIERCKTRVPLSAGVVWIDQNDVKMLEELSALVDPRKLGPRHPNNDMVICPNCTNQFVAVPVNIQNQLNNNPTPCDPPCPPHLCTEFTKAAMCADKSNQARITWDREDKFSNWKIYNNGEFSHRANFTESHLINILEASHDANKSYIDMLHAIFNR